MQKYKCSNCGKDFQSKRRKSRIRNRIWNEYVFGKQTVKDLCKKYKRSKNWVNANLRNVDAKRVPITPQPVVVVADTIFFGREYGVTVFRSPKLKRNLCFAEIQKETPSVYAEGKKHLEEKGFEILATVLDGKRGCREVFKDIPVQMCHFHQIAIVKRYLTSKPKLEAGKELLNIIFTLSKTNEETFIKLFEFWKNKWRDFLNEKSQNLETGRYCYTHKKLRSARRSIETNLPYLFTYQKYPNLNIPNTTNSLDGSFSHLRDLLRIHRGLKREKRFQIIAQILRK